MAPPHALHLVVLQHGLNGSPSNMMRLKEHLETELQRYTPPDMRIVLLNSEVSRARATYDGVDVCGAKLAKLVLAVIKEATECGDRVVRLSLIGYSLGGLIVRYAAGKLYVAGLFEDVEPANLITIASPHLGSFRAPHSVLARFFNAVVPVVASRTGAQLMLVDADYAVPWLHAQQRAHDTAAAAYSDAHACVDAAAAAPGPGPDSTGLHKRRAWGTALPEQQKDQQQEQQAAPTQHSRKRRQLPLPGVSRGAAAPLLMLMAHPAGPFHAALCRFRTRVCVASARYDTTVPYGTAAMCMSDPYAQSVPVPVHPGCYPTLVRPAAPGEVVGSGSPVLGGRLRLLLLLLALPLAPLFLAYTYATGALHLRAASRRPLEDLAWLVAYAGSGGSSSALERPPELSAAEQQDEQQQQQQQQQQDELQQQHFAALCGSAGGASAVSSSCASSGGWPSSSGGGCGSEAGTAAAAAAAAAVAIDDEEGVLQRSAQALRDADERAHLLLAASGLEEQAGIVSRPQLVHAQQAWIAAQLYDGIPRCWVPDNYAHRPDNNAQRAGSGCWSSGGWQRVDVDMGHLHAHAAIVLRDRRYARQSRDLFDWIARHMTL